MKTNYIVKTVSALTIFFFSASNISYGAVFSKDESALRSSSAGLTGVKSEIEAVFNSDRSPEYSSILDYSTLESILARVLDKAGLTRDKDVFIHIGVKKWTKSYADIHAAAIVNIARIYKAAVSGPYGCEIHKDFVNDHAVIQNNNVVLKVDFGDGVTREISVARGLAYRAFGGLFNWQGKDGGYLKSTGVEGELLWVDNDKEAAKVGGRYRIVNSAIWIWYHMLFKNTDDKVRNNNKFAAEVLDRFFDIVNNPQPYAQDEDEQVQNILKFRDQIPFLLTEDESQRKGMLKLQDTVRRLILAINALYFRIPETVPNPISLNLLDPGLEPLLRGREQSSQTEVDIFSEYPGRYGKILYGHTLINRTGFKAYITDKGKALIVKDGALIIAEPPDVLPNRVRFSDDGRYVACAGPNGIKVYDLLYPDKPKAVQEFKEVFSYDDEFFNKDKNGIYNYIIFTMRTLQGEKESLIRLRVCDLRSGKLIIDEEVIRGKEDKNKPLYRILADGRWLQIMNERKLSSGTARSLLYDLNHSAYPAMPSPAVIIHKSADALQRGIGFSPDAITEVSYGGPDERISFSPRTGEVISPKLIEASEKIYDNDGPDITQHPGISVNITKHKGYAAVSQVIPSNDPMLKGLSGKMGVKGALRNKLFPHLCKVIVFNREGKLIMDNDRPVRKFWFSPDGRYIVFWNYDYSVSIDSLKNKDNYLYPELLQEWH